ncbi:hypothetical protein ACTXT7_001255 [Hymenolepis weldensis]
MQIDSSLTSIAAFRLNSLLRFDRIGTLYYNPGSTPFPSNSKCLYTPIFLSASVHYDFSILNFFNSTSRSTYSMGFTFDSRRNKS